MDHARRSDSAFPGPRRVFTAPTYAAPPSEPTSSTSGAGVVETLYSHPSVKIVAFNAGPRPVFSHGKGIAPPPEIEPGSLPWSSQLERTIAAGQFRIYRAPGSVAFLSCGSALQPILPKSQCWCVAEDSSKYVLQIRRPQYWRIEVPVGSQDESRRAIELRGVLDQILQFEKTECPFRRGFTVELPERPQTPVKKRPWTPVSRRGSSAFLPPTPVTPADIAPIRGPRHEAPASPATKLALEIPIEALVPELSRAEDSTGRVNAPTLSEEHQEGGTTVRGTVEGAVSALEHLVKDHPKDVDAAHTGSMLAKPSGFQANRSVTAPPQLTLVTAPASNPASAEPAAEPTTVPGTERSGGRSPTDSSEGSFHSVESWTSAGAPLPPSPPLTASGSPTVTEKYLYVPKKPHQQDAADLTVTPNTPRALTSSFSDADSYPDEPQAQEPSVQDDETSSTCSVHTAEHTLQSPASTTQTELSSVAAPSSPPTPTETCSTSTTRTASASTSSSSSTVLSRRPYMRHRPTASSSISPSRRGALNRLPSAADLFPTYRSTSYSSPSSSTTSTSLQQEPAVSRLSLVRNLPRAIIHKTIEILLSPPSHLVDLMLRVAARIAAGEWRGYVFGFGEGGERIPVRWDWSDGDDDGEGELGGWGADEDWEFGTIRTRRRSSTGVRMAPGAYPDSPEEVERELGGGGELPQPQPGSPSLERRARRTTSRGDNGSAGLEGDIREDEDDGDTLAAADDGNADWTGSLSID